MDYSGIDPETGERWSARKVAKLMGLVAINDESKIQAACASACSEHPELVFQYKSGKRQVFGRLVQAVMAKTNNAANPKITARILREILDTP